MNATVVYFMLNVFWMVPLYKELIMLDKQEQFPDDLLIVH